MRPTLIGGPFDGAPATGTDPRVPAIWPRWGADGLVWYRAYPVPGRPRYERAEEGAYYIFDGLNDLLDSCVGREVAMR